VADVVVVEPETAVVLFRCPGEVAERARQWCAVDAADLSSALPWRTFLWYKGQNHHSGAWWTATEQDLVIYESRLELARLLYADFDISVHHMVAQPFLLSATVIGVGRKHIPDYLLFTHTGPVVVDVKPARRAAKPEMRHSRGRSR
jgi:hypothetical protein